MHSSTKPSGSNPPASAITLAQLSARRRSLIPTPSSRHVTTPAITRSTTRTRTRTGTRTRARTLACHEDAFIVAVIDNSVKDVLLSISSSGGLLDQAIQSCPHLANVKRTFVGRTYFNETYGALVTEKLSDCPCPTLARLGESSCYLALASCGALIRYIEHVENMVFAPSSLRFRFQPNDRAIFLDMCTLESLEVVSNARTINGLQGLSSSSSLLTVMDNTKTRAGKRFLRRSLLEPSSDIITISMRQDAVAELSNSEETYFALATVLSRFPDLEQAMSALMSRENAQLRAVYIAKNPVHLTSTIGEGNDNPEDVDESTTRPGFGPHLPEAGPPSLSLIQKVLTIKLALQAVGAMLEAIQDLGSPLLRMIAESMRNSTLLSLQREIADVIEDDAVPAKDVERMRLNGAFAVKAGLNGRLDTARKILSENIEDMQAVTEELRKKYGLYKMELCFHAKRGYHFSVPVRLLDFNDFPEEFIQIDQGKKMYRFSSEDLVQLNLRYQDSLQQIWQFTELELGLLLKKIFTPTSLSAIHQLCDSTAILDCITSFVTYASLSQVRTVRPKLTEHGPIALQQAYHPVLYNSRPETTVPNDVYLDETSAVLIISGKNQAGKSTYIRKVGLLCIMAHTGCNVPATYASVRVLRRIVTAFGLGDEVAHSQSHFSKEMSDVTTVFESIYENNTGSRGSKRYRDAEPLRAGQTEPSNILVLIDELGRSTSTLDGFAIAYAVAEKLAACRNVLTLFATHFLGLSAISTVNPLVKDFHMSSQHSDAAQNRASRNRDQQQMARFDYKLTKGTLISSSYGIETSRLAGFPKAVIDEALNLRNQLQVRRTALPTDFAEVHLRLTEAEKQLVRRTDCALTIAQRVSLINGSTVDPAERERLYSKLRKRMKQPLTRETREQTVNQL